MFTVCLVIARSCDPDNLESSPPPRSAMSSMAARKRAAVSAPCSTRFSDFAFASPSG